MPAMVFALVFALLAAETPLGPAAATAGQAPRVQALPPWLSWLAPPPTAQPPGAANPTPTPATPVPTAAPATPPATPRALTLPVLMYHDVGYGVGRYQVPLLAFRQQLDWLRAHGYTPVTLVQAYACLSGNGDLPARPVLLTFDDGRASQRSAAQELNNRGWPGVFFVMAGGTALGDGYLRELVAQGHEVEAHSLTHPFLTRLSDKQLQTEVAGAKQRLEAKLGVPVRYFAYPFGDYNARVMQAVQAAGYDGGLAAWGGSAWTPAKRWQEPRIEVGGTLNLAQFARLVETNTGRWGVGSPLPLTPTPAPG